MSREHHKDIIVDRLQRLEETVTRLVRAGVAVTTQERWDEATKARDAWWYDLINDPTLAESDCKCHKPAKEKGDVRFPVDRIRKRW